MMKEEYEEHTSTHSKAGKRFAASCLRHNPQRGRRSDGGDRCRYHIEAHAARAGAYRQGLALKNGISIVNTPGTIDADYRGEIKVILINFGEENFTVTRGARIAQMIIAPVTQVAWEQVDTLEETERASGGFGSTGLNVKVG
jgi:dUTPase